MSPSLALPLDGRTEESKVNQTKAPIPRLTDISGSGDGHGHGHGHGHGYDRI